MEGSAKRSVHTPAFLQAKWLSFFFLLSACPELFFEARGQGVVEGQIQDAETSQPLPFATIRWAAGKGVVADKEGYFQLPYSAEVLQLELRYVGYEHLQLTINPDTAGFLQLRMQKEEQALQEVVVYSGENPAHAIIEQAVANRKVHNPLRLPAYSYSSYNQFYLSLEPVTDSLLHQSEPADSLTALQQLADSSYLFFNESVTRHRKQGRQQRKEVLATRSAGTSRLLFTAVATDLQPFGFYEDYIPLLEQEYLNPLTPNSTKRYEFRLVDRLLTESDTTFIITFSPKEGRNFRGLEGVLYISSQRYALRNVIAENADAHAKIRLQIRQEYRQVAGRWFPVVLRARWFFPDHEQEGLRVVAHVQTMVKDISLQPEESLPFSRITSDFAADATEKDSLFWEEVRVEPLSPKAANTYLLLENSRTGAAFEALGRLMEVALTYRWPVGIVDVRLEDLLKVNRYEGFRPGVGLSSNARFSRWLTLGAYAGWGVRDAALKYRGQLRLQLHRPTGLYLQATYLQDLKEPGGSDILPLPSPPFLGNSGMRSWYLERMDSLRGTRLKLGISPFLRGVLLEGGLDRMQVNPTYDYRFFRPERPEGQTSFALSEAYVQLSYQHKKEVAFMGGREILVGYELPVLRLRASRGVGGTDSPFRYTRLEGLAEGRYHWRQGGSSHLQLMGGWASGELPYHRLFTLRGSAGTDSFLDVDKTFRTMGVHEFTASVYGALFYRHRLGRLKTAFKWMQPELELAHHAVWSKLSAEGTHSLDLKSVEKGYTEAGVQINDLLRINYLNVAYIGLGASLYYRYGAYAHPEGRDNFYYRILLRFAFD